MNISLLKRNAFILSAIAVLLFACDKNRHLQDLHDYVTKLKSAEASTPKKSPPMLPAPVQATYKANVLRAPFESTEAAPSGKNASTNPLEAYPLNMLRFVGTILQNDVASAYILTPDNKIYSVKPGDTIGDHNGRVKTIYSDRVEVMEGDAKDNKQAAQRLVTLQLKE